MVALPGDGSAGPQTGEFSNRGHVPVRDIEVSELRAFCAAATLGSIAEAARSMSISQPAMSKRMRALEHVAGAALFERSSRGVTLTPAGVQLYSAARRLLRSADSVQALIMTPPAMPVRIASSPTIAELRLPQVLSELALSERSISAELISANSELVRELVREGRSDLGIASVDPYALYADGLEQRIVWRDELVVVVPPGHPWEFLEEVPAADFASVPVVQRDPWSNSSRIVSATLERLGLERVPPIPAVGSAGGVIAMAQATGSPALISIMAARANPEQRLEIRRVEGLRFGLEYALVWAGPILDLRAEVQAVAAHIMHLPFARPRQEQTVAAPPSVPQGAPQRSPQTDQVYAQGQPHTQGQPSTQGQAYTQAQPYAQPYTHPSYAEPLPPQPVLAQAQQAGQPSAVLQPNPLPPHPVSLQPQPGAPQPGATQPAALPTTPTDPPPLPPHHQPIASPQQPGLYGEPPRYDPPPPQAVTAYEPPPPQGPVTTGSPLPETPAQLVLPSAPVPADTPAQ